jgi:hypothetical protein
VPIPLDVGPLHNLEQNAYDNKEYILDARRTLFAKHTGRSELSTKPMREAWVIVGRRGGKSLIAAFVAVYQACFRIYDNYLAPREVATVMVIAADRRQARVVMRYTMGLIDPVQMLKAMIERHTRETGHVVLDLVREVRPPFSPDQVTFDFCQMLKAYKCHSVKGDKNGGEWPRERFKLHEINYESSSFTNSEIYRSLLLEINSGKGELLDNQRLINQLLQLERRPVLEVVKRSIILQTAMMILQTQPREHAFLPRDLVVPPVAQGN